MSDNSQNNDKEFDEILNQLFQSMPNNLEVDIPDVEEVSVEKIERINDSLQNQIIDSFVKGENQRLSLQKPISNWVFIIFSIQLLVFNFIIFYLIFRHMPNFNNKSFELLLGFLKYYIGAVVVEIVGFVSIVLKSTFSFNSKKIIENIFKK